MRAREATAAPTEAVPTPAFSANEDDCAVAPMRAPVLTRESTGSSSHYAAEPGAAGSAPMDAVAAKSRVGRGALRSAAAEAALVAFALLAYFGVRVLARDGGAEALANAGLLMRIEEALSLAWEAPLQDAFLTHVQLVRALNWIYIWGHWPVLVGCVCYLYVRRRDVYRRLRTSMIISGLIGLLFFLSFPVAPPRLTAMGVVDTIQRYDPAYQEVAHPSRFTNQYAAMPSFHFGWNLLCGVCLAMTLRRRGLRALTLALPLVMGLAIIVTGNHYILDALVGGALSLLGLALCELLGRARRGAVAGKAGFGDG